MAKIVVKLFASRLWFFTPAFEFVTATRDLLLVSASLLEAEAI
jgi:hypothetical protein